MNTQSDSQVPPRRIGRSILALTRGDCGGECPLDGNRFRFACNWISSIAQRAMAQQSSGTGHCVPVDPRRDRCLCNRPARTQPADGPRALGGCVGFCSLHSWRSCHVEHYRWPILVSSGTSLDRTPDCLDRCKTAVDAIASKDDGLLAEEMS